MGAATALASRELGLISVWLGSAADVDAERLRSAGLTSLPLDGTLFAEQFGASRGCLRWVIGRLPTSHHAHGFTGSVPLECVRID